jgi:diaminohydroxyphosphoribosylaminopyrimidine deaminase/5-amino-6-(5-phosphoribosylamino)uracil reductase
MIQACEEAAHWIGATSPYPPVGAAALDERGRILAVTARTRAGDDYAEAALLKLCAKKKLLDRLHTLCLTLEPCNLQGNAPPCCDAIIDSGVRRVAIGERDPNPRGRSGRDKLRAAGIEVVDAVEQDGCDRLMHSFLHHARTGRPFVTVKRAFKADGELFLNPGEKPTISESSLRLVHRLRKKADAILTGAGTITIANPQFTVRRVPDYRDKVRILAIMDLEGEVPPAYLRAAVGRRLEPSLYADIEDGLRDMERRGITDILVESGPTLSESILESGRWTMLVDIHKGKDGHNDRVEVSFNPSERPPFATKGFELESILPK